MLDHFGIPAEARRVGVAIEAATSTGHPTRDIGGTTGTEKMTEAIVGALAPAHASV